MQEPITYFIDQSNGTVDLTLTRERFIARTQGKGLIDKPRTIDIPLSDLKYFCLGALYSSLPAEAVKALDHSSPA